MESKYEIGDLVWLIMDDKIQQSKVKSTNCGIYIIDGDSPLIFGRLERELFPTKQSLLDSLQ